MKTYSNKSAKKKATSKSNKSDVAPSLPNEKPSFRVEQIENGFIIEKSWVENGNYKNSKKFSEENPLEDSEENENEED